MTKRYHITNKFRFILFIVLCILLLTTMINVVLGLNTAESKTKIEYMDLEIASGDTLWSIAETYMTDAADIRQAVHQLCEINQISANQLCAGMTIQVPLPA